MDAEGLPVRFSHGSESYKIWYDKKIDHPPNLYCEESYAELSNYGQLSNPETLDANVKPCQKLDSYFGLSVKPLDAFVLAVAGVTLHLGTPSSKSQAGFWAN